MSSGYRKLYIAVIIIVILISTATISFSYFYSNSKGKSTVTPESAYVGLSLNVERVTSDNTIGLLPTQDTNLQNALNGTTNGSCVDEDGKGICQLYQITVTNTGNVISTLSSKIELYAVGENSKFTNLKWAEINSATDATPFGKVHTMNDQNWKTSFVMGPGSSSKFYILIWLSDTGKSQNNYDRGNFAGTVQFNSTAGTGANATFIG